MDEMPDNLNEFRTQYLDYREGLRGQAPSTRRLTGPDRAAAEAFIQALEDTAGIDPYASRPSIEQLLARIQRQPATAAFAAESAPAPSVALSDSARSDRLRAVLPLVKARKRGWVPKAGLEETEAAVCDLLEIAHLGEQPRFAYAARRSNHRERLTLEQQAWLGRIRQIARAQQTPRYSVQELERVARRLPGELKDGPSAMRRAVELLAECGVRVVFCEGLPGGRLAGAVTFPPTGGPVIGLTTRGDRFDSVVYTLLHECAHLALGHIDEQSGPILDNEDHAQAADDPREQQANDQATRWLFPDGLDIPTAYQDVNAAARRHSVHPSCVAGHIQHEADNWRMLNEYRCKIREELKAAALLST